MKRLIAEFEAQSFTQIIFPHKDTDWNEYLDEAQVNFVNIINAVIKYQKCLVICDDILEVKAHFQAHHNLYFVKYKTDDTWARDCSALCVEDSDDVKLLDFTFSAWGDKFDSSLDNKMSQTISKHYSKEMLTCNFILEGGAVESNGDGLILTTSTCMLNKNRNSNLSLEQTTTNLKNYFGANEIIYLNHGYLSGDDTDSHIDTLSRFISKTEIMYVTCSNEIDEHYEELKLMEQELHVEAKKHNLTLIALPMPEALYYQRERLPATYANFLFLNGAILLPVYGVKEDFQAVEIFKRTFVHLDIIPIDCSTLVRQHGSLHCVSMNFASGIDILT